MSDSPESFGDADMANQVSVELEKVYQAILDDIQDLLAASIVAGMEAQAEKDRDDIWQRKNSFRNQVRGFVSDYGLTCPDLKTKWENNLDTLVNTVIEYRKDVTIKIDQLKPTVRMTEYEKQSIGLQKQALEDKKEKRTVRENIEKEEGLAKAKKQLNSFRSDYDTLLSELTKDKTPFNDRDDVSISAAMQNLKSWKVVFNRLSNSYREYESLATVHGEQDLLADIDNEQTERVVASELFEKIKSKYNEAKM